MLNEQKNFRIGNENSDDEDNGPVYTGESKNSPHLNDPSLLLINPLWSGVAFYMDLHGHAGRKGCFIYGNSIDNELYQIENVLFTRLIAFNSQHFDFDGCNFTVRNMYMKDKREGLSKEGSGRVAMFKTLGLIHSYTLECCYAAGKVMNQIAPAQNTGFLNFLSNKVPTGMISPPLHSDLPPKFLPEHYMDVGKAVAIAALDIIEANQHSRIPNTSFGSLEAVRNWVKFYIKSKMGGGSFSNTNNASNGSLVALSSISGVTNNTNSMANMNPGGAGNSNNASNQGAGVTKRGLNNRLQANGAPNQSKLANGGNRLPASSNSFSNKNTESVTNKTTTTTTTRSMNVTSSTNATSNTPTISDTDKDKARFKPRRSIDEGTTSSKLKASNLIKQNSFKSSLQTKNDELGSIKGELKNTIKNMRELEAPTQPQQSNSQARSDTVLSLRQKTPTPQPPATLLNTRKANQSREAKVVVARKLMPITKASVMTDPSPGFESGSAYDHAIATPKPTTKTVTKFNYNIINRKVVSNANPSRLNMLNILINSNNSASGSRKPDETGGKSVKTALTLVQTNIESMHGSSDKSVFDSAAKNEPVDKSEFEHYSDDSNALNREKVPGKLVTVDDSSLPKPSASLPTKSTEDKSGGKERVFFSVSIQRPSMKFIRRTKSVFFT
jgi:hypothetical protein